MMGDGNQTEMSYPDQMLNDPSLQVNPNNYMSMISQLSDERVSGYP